MKMNKIIETINPAQEANSEESAKSEQAISTQSVNPQLCPFCAKDNACSNVINNSLACDEKKKLTCWCQDPNIKFPPELLPQVPDELKNKTCICQSCAMEFKV
jgi:hypothetical protein